MAFKANEIDPREATVQEDVPTYRVDFWGAGEEDAASLDVTSRCDTWRVEGAQDVEEVFGWVSQVQAGRRPVVYVEVSLPGGGIHLSRIRGVDPLDSAWTDRI